MISWLATCGHLSCRISDELYQARRESTPVEERIELADGTVVLGSWWLRKVVGNG